MRRYYRMIRYLLLGYSHPFGLAWELAREWWSVEGCYYRWSAYRERWRRLRRDWFTCGQCGRKFHPDIDAPCAYGAAGSNRCPRCYQDPPPHAA